MQDTCFGEMTFKHGWIVNTQLEWGDTRLTIKVKNLSTAEQTITEFQRTVYLSFKNNTSTYVDTFQNALFRFCKKHYDPSLTKEQTLKVATPVTMLIHRENIWGVLFKVKWESEINIAVKVTLPENKIECGVDDILL